MAKTSTCSKTNCGTTVEGTVSVCPTCGARMGQSSGIRTMGCIVFFLGLFFAGSFGAIMFAALPTMMNPAEAIANHTANGTLEQMEAIRLLFFAFLFAGVVMLYLGFRLLMTGRPVKFLALLILASMLPILLTAYNAMQYMPKSKTYGSESGDDR